MPTSTSAVHFGHFRFSNTAASIALPTCVRLFVLVHSTSDIFMQMLSLSRAQKYRLAVIAASMTSTFKMMHSCFSISWFDSEAAFFKSVADAINSLAAGR
jgi:hypothetical protein